MHVTKYKNAITQAKTTVDLNGLSPTFSSYWFDSLKVTKPYKEEIDAAFYEAEVPAQKLLLGDGFFAIYWPQDGHMPCLNADGAETVKTVVVKVEI